MKIFPICSMKSVNAEQVVLQENTNNPFISRPKYPDFRFQCPGCGSLEVFVARENENTSLKGKCLDCTKNWFEGVRTL